MEHRVRDILALEPPRRVAQLRSFCDAVTQQPLRTRSATFARSVNRLTVKKADGSNPRYVLISTWTSVGVRSATWYIIPSRLSDQPLGNNLCCALMPPTRVGARARLCDGTDSCFPAISPPAYGTGGNAYGLLPNAKRKRLCVLSSASLLGCGGMRLLGMRSTMWR